MNGEVNQVTIDSRKVTNNCLFVAIKGEKTDGHEYVANVVANGTNFALVSDDFELDLPNLIRVPDTTIALGMIAHNYRLLFTIPVVGITGSNGKTTVKEMLREVCQIKFGTYNVLATSGNLNNHLGMPLTLLELDIQHQVAIIEMGMNHSGELDYLTKIAAPTIAVVNNVMFAHAGHFNSLAEIAAAKGEIYHGLNASGIACVDISNDFSASWLSEISKNNCQVFNYGTPQSGCYLDTITPNGAIYQTTAGELKVKLQILGRHNYYNALSVIALGLNIGCSLEEIRLGLERYRGYKGRLERKIAFNGAIIIDDTYNANPDSVMAALEAIQELPEPRWLVFGDLKELGEKEQDFHRNIGIALNKYCITTLLTIGELTPFAADYFSGGKIHFVSNQDIVKYCLLHLPESATLLIKGSNSMRLYDVVNNLSKNN